MAQPQGTARLVCLNETAPKGPGSETELGPALRCDDTLARREGGREVYLQSRLLKRPVLSSLARFPCSRDCADVQDVTLKPPFFRMHLMATL